MQPLHPCGGGHRAFALADAIEQNRTVRITYYPLGFRDRG